MRCKVDARFEMSPLFLSLQSLPPFVSLHPHTPLIPSLFSRFSLISIVFDLPEGKLDCLENCLLGVILHAFMPSLSPQSFVNNKGVSLFIMITPIHRPHALKQSTCYVYFLELTTIFSRE